MIRYFTAGESHGPQLTAILEGMPAGLPLTEEIINRDLGRRQLLLGAGGRMKIETDKVQITAGVMNGHTTGAPIALQIINADHVNWKGKEIPPYTIPRPGHCDLSATIKYHHEDIRPALERASARETAARVAVGAVCRALLSHFGITITGQVIQIGPEPDPEKFEHVIEAARAEGNTLGGIIEVVVDQVPVGLGSYVQWDRRLDAQLAYAMMGIPAMKGVEIGDAFANAALPGTQVHDAINPDLTRDTNNCGGIEGGMSNGQPIVIYLAMKPIPTTLKSQNSMNLITGKFAETKYERSDVCPVPRAVIVAEASAAFVIAKALLEKVGGDSIVEITPRVEQIKKAKPHLSGTPHIFWP
jgi:chorismate synthase